MNVTPNFHFNGDCKDALELYEEAFKGEILTIMYYRDADSKDFPIESLSNEEKDYVYHAEMNIGSQRFMFSDKVHSISKGQNISIVITFTDPNEVENAYALLIKEGKIIRPLSETTYSRCFTSLLDKFGNRWELMTRD